MTESQNLLLILARNSRGAAELLRDAICDGCENCAAQISDINRHTLFELSEGERHFLAHKENREHLRAAHVLSNCVTRAFSAALLLERDLPQFSPLNEIAVSAAQLAAYAEQLLTSAAESHVPTYSLHLCANKGRGAHALFLTNICSIETGRRLLPLALALEAHRNSLEHAYGVLMEVL